MVKQRTTITVSIFVVAIILLTAFSISVCAEENTTRLVSTSGNAVVSNPTDAFGSIITVSKDPVSGEWKTYANGVETHYSGLASNTYGTWYCENGKVDFNYSGIAKDGNDQWVVQEGKVNYGLDGQYKEDENSLLEYTIVGGKVEKTNLTQKTKDHLTVALLLLAIVIAILVAKRNKKQGTKTQTSAPVSNQRPVEQNHEKPKIKVTAKPVSPLTPEEDALGNKDLPYRKKYLLTKNEYRFYESLRPIADTLGLDVLAKIRMGDLVRPLPNWNKSEWYSQWGRVKARHVDFALVDPASMYVKLLIELDDASHNGAQAQEIDQFKNDVYASAGYKLLRVRNDERLEDKIRWKLKE